MGKTISAARITQMFDRLLHACDELAHTFLPRQTLDLALIDIATTEALVPLSDLIEKLERMQTRTNVINAVPQEMAMTDTQQDTSLSSQKTTHQKFPRPASLAPASSASAPSLPQVLLYDGFFPQTMFLFVFLLLLSGQYLLVAFVDHKT